VRCAAPPAAPRAPPRLRRAGALAGARSGSRRGGPSAVPASRRCPLPGARARSAPACRGSGAALAPGAQPAGRPKSPNQAHRPAAPAPAARRRSRRQDPSRPHPLELVGRKLVLWRDGGGAWRAHEDACPHRLAPLSEGRVEGGQLECSYHGALTDHGAAPRRRWGGPAPARAARTAAAKPRGAPTLPPAAPRPGWRFDGDGRCARIPQALDSKAEATARASPRSCARAYPAREEAGLIWVWADGSPGAEAEAGARAWRLGRAARPSGGGERALGARGAAGRAAGGGGGERGGDT
jgi:nitrite reductase/ring-hydroxylating ferredoxin subunit